MDHNLSKFVAFVSFWISGRKGEFLHPRYFFYFLKNNLAFFGGHASQYPKIP
jgi:hypothetical protein